MDSNADRLIEQWYRRIIHHGRSLAAIYHVDFEEVESIALAAAGVAVGILDPTFSPAQQWVFIKNAITFDVMNHVRKEASYRRVKARLRAQRDHTEVKKYRKIDKELDQDGWVGRREE